MSVDQAIYFLLVKLTKNVCVFINQTKTVRNSAGNPFASSLVIASSVLQGIGSRFCSSRPSKCNASGTQFVILERSDFKIVTPIKSPIYALTNPSSLFGTNISLSRAGLKGINSGINVTARS